MYNVNVSIINVYIYRATIYIHVHASIDVCLPAQLHVHKHAHTHTHTRQPAFSETPITSSEGVQKWLRFYTMSAPLICLSEFISHDPVSEVKSLSLSLCECICYGPYQCNTVCKHSDNTLLIANRHIK